MAKSGNKTLIKQWKLYNEALKQGGAKIPEMEALRPFMGKRGGVSKRNTRSKRQQAAFNAAKQGIKGKYGRKTSGINWKEEQRKAKRKQQTKTAGQNAAINKARRQHKKKPDFNKPLTGAAKRTVEEAERKYDRMIDILDKGSRQVLSAKVRYELYKVLDEQNVSDEDIETFVDKLLEALDDIPEEARALNAEDDFYQTLLDIRDMGVDEADDLKAMFITLVNNPEDKDGVMESIRYFQEHNDNGMSYEQFYNILSDNYNDMWDISNYEEVLNGE